VAIAVRILGFGLISSVQIFASSEHRHRLAGIVRKMIRQEG
jgi:hypothetical protein